MAQIDITYHNLLNEILDKGFTYEDPNRKGVKRVQIPSYTFKHEFKDGFPAITTKKLYWKGVVGELLWFLRGDTNIKYLVDNGINIWNKDALNYSNSGKLGKGDIQTEKEFLKDVCNGTQMPGDLGRVYGAQWRNWSHGLFNLDEGEFYQLKGTDQISNLIQGLKKNPMGTRHIVTAWNPAELDEMALPPCHWSFEVLVEPMSLGERTVWAGDNMKFHELLEIPKYQFTLKWHQRSVDTFLGLPFNIASYALLAQMISGMTGYMAKGIIGDLSNVHIYEPHLDAVNEQLSRNVYKYDPPTLSFVNGTFPKLSDNLSLDETLSQININNFSLTEYNSYPAIKADMLPYNK